MSNAIDNFVGYDIYINKGPKRFFETRSRRGGIYVKKTGEIYSENSKNVMCRVGNVGICPFNNGARRSVFDRGQYSCFNQKPWKCIFVDNYRLCFPDCFICTWYGYFDRRGRWHNIFLRLIHVTFYIVLLRAGVKVRLPLFFVFQSLCVTVRHRVTHTSRTLALVIFRICVIWLIYSQPAGRWELFFSQK